jgi:hypothetical protein
MQSLCALTSVAPPVPGGGKTWATSKECPARLALKELSTCPCQLTCSSDCECPELDTYVEKCVALVTDHSRVGHGGHVPSLPAA